MTISLAEDGKVFRDDKHIATVTGDDIDFKHYSYKKHREEIEMLMEDDEPIADIGLEPISGGEPLTPIELFNTSTGKWYGEEDPHVVNWRSEHWSKRSFDERYAHKEELLHNNFAEQGMKYKPNK